jgi:hypothetical protein
MLMTRCPGAPSVTPKKFARNSDLMHQIQSSYGFWNIEATAISAPLGAGLTSYPHITRFGHIRRRNGVEFKFILSFDIAFDYG